MLHHNNAQCHTAEKSIPEVSHSPICWISVPVTCFYYPGSKTTGTGANFKAITLVLKKE
jgi:hypothetical protein